MNADWVVKLDSDTVLMSLDFLDEQYEYIGSSRKGEKKFYTWGGCVAYKVQAVRDIAAEVEDKEYLRGLELLCTNKRWQQNEDVLFGYTATIKLGKSSLIGDLCTDGNLFMYISDSQTLNPKASAASCKGRYISWLYRPSLSHVTDKSLLTTESVLGRMREADNVVKNRVKAKFSLKESDSTPKYGNLKKMTILVATFTYGKDEKLARFGMKSVQSLRKLYPQHKIVHYLIDDANNPFATPFEDEGDTHYTKTTFSRNGNLIGTEAFCGEVEAMAMLAEKTEADWVVKADSDVVLMQLDFLNNEYDYIGSRREAEVRTPYVWGTCCAFKGWVVREMWKKIHENEQFLPDFLKKHNISGRLLVEDLCFGTVAVHELNARLLWGGIGADNNLYPFISDDRTPNQTAFAVTCRGRFLKDCADNHPVFVREERLVSEESVLQRMKQSYENIQKNAAALSKNIETNMKKTNILVLTFTQKEDEQLARANAKSIQTLRKLYP